MLADYIQTVEQAAARVQRLTADIGELVERWTLGPLVRALQALRGVDLVTAGGARRRDRQLQTLPHPQAVDGLSRAWCPASTPAAALGGREELPARAIAMHAGCWWKPLGTIAFVRAARSEFTRVDNGWRPACAALPNERSSACCAALED